MTLARSLVLFLLALGPAGPASADPGGSVLLDTFPVTIAQPGTYRLDASVVVDGDDAITVTASDVVIDLCGFELSTTTGEFNGVRASATERVTVRNGRLVGFRRAISLGSEAVVEDLHVSGGFDGIRVGARSRVERCRALSVTGQALKTGAASVVRYFAAEVDSSTAVCVDLGGSSVGLALDVEGGNLGIVVGRGGVLRDSSTRGFVGRGIDVLAGARAEACTAESGTNPKAPAGFLVATSGALVDCAAVGAFTGVLAQGFAIVEGVVVNNCETGLEVDRGTRVERASVFASQTVGILAVGSGVVVRNSVIGGSFGDGLRFDDAGGTVVGCQVLDSGGNGIVLGDVGVARENLVQGSGAAGILCAGDRTRVEDNTLDANDVGVHVDGMHALVRANRATNSATSDFQFGAKDVAGPVLWTTGWLTNASAHANYRTPFF